MRKSYRFPHIFLVIAVACACVAIGQPPKTAKVELGSRTAKLGFQNENEIAAKFNNWKTDEDAQAWLAAMNYRIADIVSIAATRPHGEKADVQVKIRTKTAESTEGISIKLVSSVRGFNQIDKRWLANYARMWKMPPDVIAGLKLFVGEIKPNKTSRDPDRMFLSELSPEVQRSIVDFFTANKDLVVSDIFEGDGPFAARWFLVALKSDAAPQWILRSSRDAARFFSTGPVVITRNGSLRIGRITMQRKGGDGGRETAKMLQFKIDPAQIIDAN